MRDQPQISNASGVTGPKSGTGQTVKLAQRTDQPLDQHGSPGSTKGRKLVVCIDGTSNQYSDKNTNVIELYSAIKKDTNQLTYYNSGVGTYAKPSWRSYTYLKQVLNNVIDLAIAWNLEKVIIGAYRWLSDTYRPDDQIFLFGFSRGAYQVRALAAMIESVGLLYAGNQEQISFAWELYSDRRHSGKDHQARIRVFKETFSRKEVKIHFLGAWDTVSSIGLVRGNLLPLTENCAYIAHFRHALALDERRVKFLPEHVLSTDHSAESENHTVKEVWFVGTHSDIGGGNIENRRLQRGAEPLIWMKDEAKARGLEFSPYEVTASMKLPEVNESLVKGWWLLEYLPLSRHAYRSGESFNKSVIWRPHRGKGRKVLREHKLHWTVMANCHRVIDVGGSGYKPRASMKVGDQKVDWRDVTSISSSSWEGDTELVTTLKLINEVNTTLNPESQSNWLQNVNECASKEENLDTLWRYGQASFLRDLTNIDQENRGKAVVRSVVGFTSVPHNTRGLMRDQISVVGHQFDFEETVFPRLASLIALCKIHESTVYSNYTAGGSTLRGRFLSLNKRGSSTGNVKHHVSAPPLQDPSSTRHLSMIVTEMVLWLTEYVDQCSEGPEVYEVKPIYQDFPGLIPTGDLIIRSREYKALAQAVVKTVARIIETWEGANFLDADNAIKRIAELLALCETEKYLVLDALQTLRALEGKDETASFFRNRKTRERILALIVKVLEHQIDEIANTDLDDQILGEALALGFAPKQHYSDDSIRVLYKLVHPVLRRLMRLTDRSLLNNLTSMARNEEVRAELAQGFFLDKVSVLSLYKGSPEEIIKIIELLSQYDNSRQVLISNNVSKVIAALLGNNHVMQDTLKAVLGLAQHADMMSQQVALALGDLIINDRDVDLLAAKAFARLTHHGSQYDRPKQRVIRALVRDALAATTHQRTANSIRALAELAHQGVYTTAVVALAKKLFPEVLKAESYVDAESSRSKQLKLGEDETKSNSKDNTPFLEIWISTLDLVTALVTQKVDQLSLSRADCDSLRKLAQLTNVPGELMRALTALLFLCELDTNHEKIQTQLSERYIAGCYAETSKLDPL